MSTKEADLLVSILNYITEEVGWEVDTEGFGYNPIDATIDCVDVTCEEGLEALWNEVIKWKLIPKSNG